MGKKEYLVKWKDWIISTWEPEEYLSSEVPDIVQEYESKNKNKKAVVKKQTPKKAEKTPVAKKGKPAKVEKTPTDTKKKGKGRPAQKTPEVKAKKVTKTETKSSTP